LIEEQLEEEILFMPAELLKETFRESTTIDSAKAEVLLALFSSRGDFRGRESVEADGALVQALPVVIVRNKSGDILRLKRRERRPDNPLHEKLVIWAGGHVRREDATNGTSVRVCAVRELQEELRLNVEPNDLRLLGAIRVASGGRTRLHVAIVYEWRALSDDVEIASATPNSSNGVARL